MLSTNKNKQKRIAKDFLKQLDDNCNKFIAMTCKNSPFWPENNFNEEIEDSVVYLKDYKVVYTIMLSILYAKKLPDFVFHSFRILTLFMKRTLSVKNRFSIMEEYEKFFAALAKKFRQGKGPKNIKEFFGEIKILDAKKSCWGVTHDPSFIEQVSTRDKFNNRNNATKILIELVNYLQRKQTKATQIDESNVTLEHIFPQKPSNVNRDWPDFQDEDLANFNLDKLGNLTLLHGKPNTSLSNKSFDEKKKLYDFKESGVVLTGEICDYSGWTKESIRERQKRLAKLAAEVWSFKEYEK